MTTVTDAECRTDDQTTTRSRRAPSTSARATRAARWALLALTIAVIPTACGRDRDDDTVKAAGWQPNLDGEVLDVPLDELKRVVAERLSSAEPPRTIDARQWKRTRQLYQSYGDSPLWFDGDGLSDRARALVRTLTEAHTDALRLSAYPLDDALASLRAVTSTDRPTADQIATADLVLTATYVALAEDLLTGQVDPRSVSQGWHIDPQQVDVDSAVARTLGADRFDLALSGLRPHDSTYTLLREQLARYRKLAATGWTRVPTGKAVKPGDRAPTAQLRAVRSRLAAEGYPTDGDPTASDVGGAAGRTVYDHRLAGAVATFQARHGIEVDSILGGQTIASLNLPASYRAGQIAANMERLRWLPNTLGARHVLVNVPAFQVQAFENGKVALEMKVVVGAEYDDRSTPTFSDSMSTVVFRPYWNVPDGIAEEEIYPKAAVDPGYMERKNYEVVTENGETRVRQKPGEDNSLGLVKFLFPNEFAIYLHDTPDSTTFAQDVRAASHGCIRLERPADFARWVLGWDAARVEQAMHAGPDDNEVALERKIPVYIVYFTAFARNGQLSFGNDLYDRDRALVERLSQGGAADTAARQTAAELEKLIAD
ncbi:MAG: L,D-transpeptidase family protein [Gemmatimonadaceae bacterium]